MPSVIHSDFRRHFETTAQMLNALPLPPTVFINIPISDALLINGGFFSRFSEITHKLPIFLRLFYGCYPLRQYCAELQLFSEWQKNKYPL